MTIDFVKYDQSFLSPSEKWLTDPEIKTLTNAGSFSKEDQLNWFNSLSQKTNYFIWGIEISGIKIGACGLKNISQTDCEYWGYIGEKEYWDKGIGTQILKMMESKAIELGLKSIWLQVLLHNAAAISLYVKNGYQVESTDAALQHMRKKI